METAVATALPPAAVQPVTQQVVFSKEETGQLLSALAQPFDPSVIKWVVKATTQSKEGKRRGLVAAYADPRAYSDRLNQLLTPLGWTQEYSMHVVQDFQRKNGGKETCASAKVMVICRVTVFGLNSHSGTGEEWADNDNALTSADAQAFKRACSCFGLGRYLYSVPQVWVELDEFKRPVRLPDLPAWALPEGHRAQKGSQKSNGAGASAQTTGTGIANGNGHGSTAGVTASNGSSGAASTGNGTNDRGKVLAETQQLSKSVGRKLFVHVLQTFAGVDSVSRVSDPGKLKLILDRLQNVQRGTQRLKAAIGTVGMETLREECEKLKLPGVTTDDIPDTTVLRKLIERLEARAKAAQSSAASAATGGSQQARLAPSNKTKPVSAELVQVRNEVLTQARRQASQSKRSIEDVIARASDGCPFVIHIQREGGLTMTVSKTTKTAPELRLAKRVWRSFAEAGIFAPAQVSLEHQHLAQRYVVRGVEAGGAVAVIGHYVTFAGADGEPLRYLHPLDSVGVNGVHAVVVAQTLVRVEVFRSGRTYQVLISKHAAGEIRNGRRPSIETEVLFKGLDGYLNLELWGRDRARAGSALPQFYTPGGELMEIPAAFEPAILGATRGAVCIGCRHSHYLVADISVPPRERERSSVVLPVPASCSQEALR